MIQANRSLTIVIPVYNAFNQAVECIESVLLNSTSENLLVVDDASPDGEFAAALDEHLLQNSRLKVIRNSSNLGFAGSCNFAIEHEQEKDLIFLNSDTLVAGNWIKNLSSAAYSSDLVATVTPLTNRGTICSIPRFCTDNELPLNLSVNDLSVLVEESSKKQYPELPTCVGFCVYIKRDVINKIGGFDAAAFGRGYGEENDFSCRAQKAGYVDILDDSTFIFHHGNMSFGSDKSELEKTNTETLKRKHPHYFDSVAKFCARDPLRDIRNRISDQLVKHWNQRSEKRVLQILHNGPHVERNHPLGGTELQVRDLIEGLTSCSSWSLVPSKYSYYLTAHFPGGEREYVFQRQSLHLKELITSEFFDLVHLQHPKGFDQAELSEALLAHGNFQISFNDYSLVCPRFHLYTPFHKVCNGHECTTTCGYSEDAIGSLRKNSAKLLETSNTNHCFSKSTIDYIDNILPNKYNWKQNGLAIKNKQSLDGVLSRKPNKPGKGSPLKVLFLGYLPLHKGSSIIQELVKQTKIDNVPVEWHVLGKLFFENNKVIQHGEYEREDLTEKLAEIDPHVVLILSLCPETYCLTLDEAWNAGVPTIVTPLGAPAERVKASGAGWVLNELSSSCVIDTLEKLINDWNGYLNVRNNIAQTNLIGTEEQITSYQESYQEASNGSDSNFDKLETYLQLNAQARAPKPSILRRVIGRLISYGIYLLDSVRLRGPIEKMAYSLVPKRILDSLKAAR